MALSLVLASAAVVFAQQQRGRIWVGGPQGRNGARFATIDDFKGNWIYCRAFFTNGFGGGRGFGRGGGGGGGWSTDYPGADNNFSVRLGELTRVHVPLDENRQPNFVVVSLTDTLLYRCPMLFMEEPRNLLFSDEEVTELRKFFLKGGFLWVDDFWGSYALENWVTQIGRVLPPREYPMFDIPLDHPVMHTLYQVPNIPQVPAINFWARTGGETSEQGADSAEVHFRGINDKNGRLMVLTSHNTDIADTWEREGNEPRAYFDLFSPRGYAIGVNVVLYAMTH